MLENTIYLDLETTGFAAHDQVLQIAILADPEETPLLNTYISPIGITEWPDAMKVHGIDFETVKHSPPLDYYREMIIEAVSGRHVVIYNAPFERRFIGPELRDARSVQCAMRAFKEEMGLQRWVSLSRAAQHVCWPHLDAHTALGDVRATRAVWRYLTVAEERNRIDLMRQGV